MSPRKARAAWPRLHCLKSNLSRVLRSPVATLTQRDVAMCRPLTGWGMLPSCKRQVRTARHQEIFLGKR